MYSKIQKSATIPLKSVIQIMRLHHHTQVLNRKIQRLPLKIKYSLKFKYFQLVLYTLNHFDTDLFPTLFLTILTSYLFYILKYTPFYWTIHPCFSLCVGVFFSLLWWTFYEKKKEYSYSSLKKLDNPQRIWVWAKNLSQ